MSPLNTRPPARPPPSESLSHPSAALLTLPTRSILGACSPPPWSRASFRLTTSSPVLPRFLHAQAALLYTTPEGARRVRVHTLALPVTDNVANVFKGVRQTSLL